MHLIWSSWVFLHIEGMFLHMIICEHLLITSFGTWFHYMISWCKFFTNIYNQISYVVFFGMSIHIKHVKITWRRFIFQPLYGGIIYAICIYNFSSLVNNIWELKIFQLKSYNFWCLMIPRFCGRPTDLNAKFGKP